MTIHRIAPARLAKLQAESLTYAEVGATRETMPAGYRHLQRTRVLRNADLASAGAALFDWQVQRRTGLRVASSQPLDVGTVVVLSVGISRFALQIPCRVVYVIDEPRRRGFGYGTLPGHPESGEEAFVLDEAPDGTIRFTITAFSRPATMPAKLIGPVGRGIQDLTTTRYLRALDR